jgi:hypothetical protein
MTFQAGTSCSSVASRKRGFCAFVALLALECVQGVGGSLHGLLGALHRPAFKRALDAKPGDFQKAA